MSGTHPDIETNIPLSVGEAGGNPQFAASMGAGNNVFTAFVEDNKIKLKCSREGGKNMSTPIEILDVPGTVKLLKIGAKGDIAVVVAVEDSGSELNVKGCTGTISPLGISSTFTHQACPANKLPLSSDILDLAIRINDDGTSDDYVFVKATTGANVSHVGHHPRAPS